MASRHARCDLTFGRREGRVREEGEDEAEWTGPELRKEGLVHRWYACCATGDEVVQHTSRADMHDEGIVAGPAFGGVDGSYGGFGEGGRAEPVDGFGREGDEATGLEDGGGGGEGSASGRVGGREGGGGEDGCDVRGRHGAV